MSNKNEENESGHNVTNIGGSQIGGSVTVSGNSRFVGGNDYSTNESTVISISQSFEPIYRQIDDDPKIDNENKPEVKELVKEVETELSTSENPNEKYLSRLFKDLIQMAPDIFEVAWKTAVNPISGLSLAVKKIVDKAANDAKEQLSPTI